MANPKPGLRRTALLRRAALTPGQHEAAALALHDAVLALAPTRVAAYASIGDEPDTSLLRAAHPGVLLPVLQDDGDLDWAVDDGPLTAGLRGTLQPVGPLLGRHAVAGCDLVVVPALGVDRSGTRLGRGGGAYDRALVRATGYVLVALQLGELHDWLPREAHDRPVDAAVLPGQGLVRLRCSSR